MDFNDIRKCLMFVMGRRLRKRMSKPMTTEQFMVDGILIIDDALRVVN